jgi:nicotinate-nucleotide adenylyltransferase
MDAPQPNEAPNYTVDTLERLRQEMPGATVFNLVGADSFLSLRKWREPERLLELAEWIVASRPGYPLEDLTALALTSAERGRVHLLETVHYEVSSTALRQRLEAGDDCRDLLPAPVADFIEAHGLYTR